MSLIISALILFLAPLLSALPEEPMWSMVFVVFLLISCTMSIIRSKGMQCYGRSTLAILGVPTLAIVSLLFHWLVENKCSPAYLDVMLRGAVFWISAGAVFVLSSTDRSPVGIYSRLLAITAGASVAAGVGIQDYLVHLRGHEAQWREFGTSTPDFFAGHLVMTFPIALALLLGAKSGKDKIFWLLYLLSVLMQMAVIPTTGSRFALISLAFSAAVFLALLVISIRGGMSFSKASRSRLTALVVVALLVAAVVARPILYRLQGSTLAAQAHSGNFRAWTWKGTTRLIESNPLLGTGPGTFVYAYPKRAIVGFTRHAHSAYLQTAADLGVPALLLMLAGIGMIVYRAILSLMITLPESAEPSFARKRKDRKLATEAEPKNGLMEMVTLTDSRYLVLGVLAALAAALLQNVIDSDWFTFASGITFFGLIGSLAALSRSPEKEFQSKWFATAVGGVCAVGSLVATDFALAEVQITRGNYSAAIDLDPINASYHAKIAKEIYIPEGDLANTESSLQSSVRLAPDAVGYALLGEIYLGQGQIQLALTTFQTGLMYDPNSVQLMLKLATALQSEGNDGEALGYYQRVANLEMKPFGTVRAIPEVSEAGFADADAAVGESLLDQQKPAEAVVYLERAANNCEDYFQPNGYAMRQAMTLGKSNSVLDSHMSNLYGTVVNALVEAYDAVGDAADAKSQKAQLDTKLLAFQSVINKGS